MTQPRRILLHLEKIGKGWAPAKTNACVAKEPDNPSQERHADDDGSTDDTSSGTADEQDSFFTESSQEQTVPTDQIDSQKDGTIHSEDASLNQDPNIQEVFESPSAQSFSTSNDTTNRTETRQLHDINRSSESVDSDNEALHVVNVSSKSNQHDSVSPLSQGKLPSNADGTDGHINDNDIEKGSGTNSTNSKEAIETTQCTVEEHLSSEVHRTQERFEAEPSRSCSHKTNIEEEHQECENISKLEAPLASEDGDDQAQSSSDFDEETCGSSSHNTKIETEFQDEESVSKIGALPADESNRNCESNAKPSELVQVNIFVCY